ncbi:MAG: amino acid--tRNA ligase-related protein [Desulfomonilia bacterium]|jgi:aspartyl/asparaginyl-tRNA synthetase
MAFIGEDLFRFQASLVQSGMSLEGFIQDNYLNKWTNETLHCAMKIRTSFVNAISNFLADEGLVNLERVQMSPVTDPLAHDVEHVPTIHYKGMPYVVTHSMIYMKFLACFNRHIKGIYVDSPNIRLEIESPQKKQRGKYLIDFSQIDIELRRNRGIGMDDYLNSRSMVEKVLKEDFEKIIDFFERMIVAACEAIAAKNEDELKALGVALEAPKRPFPRVKHMDVIERYGRLDTDAKVGNEISSQFFWITGIMRENYDLIYPYLQPDGSKLPLSAYTSDMIYNYDLCAKPLLRATNSYGSALEILSGAIREWLYEPIVQRLIDNRIIPEVPVFNNGVLENISILDGYGPFLTAVHMGGRDGRPPFPDTMGGGIGVERTLYALLKGPKIEKIDDLTCFGKNPDSHPIFLY